MSSETSKRHQLLIFDDREKVDPSLASIVGQRNFGSIHLRNQSIYNRALKARPDWLSGRTVHMTRAPQERSAYKSIPGLAEANGVIVMAARGVAIDQNAIKQILERFPMSDSMIVDRRRNPLLIYFPSVEVFVDHWELVSKKPLHLFSHEWNDALTIKGTDPLIDISSQAAFLNYVSGATLPRAFNQIEIDSNLYIKKSKDIDKLRAEHDYYGLIPQAMKPWMVGAFDFSGNGESAQYSMLRYYIADAAIQWVHSAWSEQQFSAFINRILFFLNSRPAKSASKSDIEAVSGQLFRKKVQARLETLKTQEKGREIIRFFDNSTSSLTVDGLFQNYYDQLDKHWSSITKFDQLTVGHGDPCLSNILYDSGTQALKLIDPKGAIEERELWTHPLYDYAKLAHSILGDYDFINNKLFSVKLNDDATLNLSLTRMPDPNMKRYFLSQLPETISPKALQLGVVSLFLSMLPLHLDHPDKVVAFLLNAQRLLTRLS